MLKYSVVIPAHNEQDFLGITLNSIVNQTKLPSELIIVNDNSTDDTEDIIDTYVKKHAFIRKVNNRSNKNHSPGAKVVNAFYKGYYELNLAYDIIVKLDADLILPKIYFERICKYFEQDEQVGIASGLLHIKKNERWIRENISDYNHVRGPIKAYRKNCFEQIGGLKRSLGWDTVDVLLARFYGWNIKVNGSLIVKHLRPTGDIYEASLLRKQGGVLYKLRYGIFISLVAILKISIVKRDFLTFVSYLKGYIKANINNETFLVTSEEGIFIRNYRRKIMLQKILKFLNKNFLFKNNFILIVLMLQLVSCNSYGVKTNFSLKYKVENHGKSTVEVHSPIELFHVILALTDVGQQDNYMLRKNTHYYTEVQERFSEYRNKRIVRLINKKLTQSPHSYHKFVKFFYNFHFKNQNLVMKEELEVYSSYKKYIPLMEDFAKTSNYFEFFENHLDYYQEHIEFQMQVVDTKKMWEWLESEFTNRYKCYKTVFSPLTGGNHSTINFAQEEYKETVFFVSVPYTKSNNQYYSAQLSGIVFTEIDHNYVNPISKKYISEIENALANRHRWVIESDVTYYYKTPYEVFNEYLTHALFCLYASETFDTEIANAVIEKRIELMEKLRGFKNFGLFTSHLLKLRGLARDKPIEKLYPQIIEWFKHSQKINKNISNNGSN